MRSLFFVLLVLWANNLNAQQFMQAANGKRGCVDFDGEILFPFELEESDITTLPPTYSLMILRKNGLYGLFNSKGKVQVPFKYERIEKLEFNDVNPQKAHFTVTQKGKKGIIDENNHTILPTKFDTIFLHSGYLLALKKRDSIFHAYNLSGKLLFKFAGNISKKYPPLMNYVYVTTPTNSEAIYSDNGLIEVTNKLPSGNCMVQYNIKSPDSLHKKPKLIHGEWAMPCEYTIIKAGVSGQFIVQYRDSLQGVLDINNRVIVPIGHYFISKYGEIYWVYTRARKTPSGEMGIAEVSIYNSQGALILSEPSNKITGLRQYLYNKGEECPDSYWQNFFTVKTGKQLVLYTSKTGKPIPNVPGSFYYYSKKHPLLCPLLDSSKRWGDRYYLYDFTGKNLLPNPYLYLNFTPDPDIFIGIDLSEKRYGFIHISDKGASAVFEFNRIEVISKSYFIAHKNDQMMLFGPKGKPLNNEIYLDIRKPDEYELKYFPRIKGFKGTLVAIVKKSKQPHPLVTGVSSLGKEYQLDIHLLKKEQQERTKREIPEFGKKTYINNKIYERLGPEPPPQPRINEFIYPCVHVEGGFFQMGRIPGNNQPSKNDCEQLVQVSGFDIGKYEVTQAQWQYVTDHNPSYYKDCMDCPVENVSWNQVQEFISLLNKKQSQITYRLPTEAEWEYAAQGGEKDGPAFSYAGSNKLNDVAWNLANSAGTTHPVGQKQPNELGLYDMSGNIEEWCQDIWIENPCKGRDGFDNTINYVLRGGSLIGFGPFTPITHRRKSDPNELSTQAGFRLCATLRK